MRRLVNYLKDINTPNESAFGNKTPVSMRIVAAGLYGALIWALLPRSVVPYNDDFGYFRSVVETIQHRRPWTDEWLEPWAASLSILSALIYLVTGSFTAATHGLQAILSAIAFLGFIELLRLRKMPLALAVVASLATLLFPTLLWKELEFNSLCLYLPCLIWVLFFYEERNWIGFAVCWSLAITCRQSAVAWGVLPVLAFYSDRRARSLLIGPAGTLAFGVGIYYFASTTMNVTHAQRVMTRNVLGNIQLQPFVEHIAIGAAVFLVGTGFSLAFRHARSCSKISFSDLIRSGLVFIFLALTSITCLGTLGFEHGGFLDRGTTFVAMLSLVSAFGWLYSGTVRVEYALCAAAAIFLTGGRCAVWDYYYIDVLIIALFSSGPLKAFNGRQQVHSNLILRLLPAILVLGIGISFSSGRALRLKRQLDGYTAVVTLCEKALRAGTITPADLSIAPFGYVGWSLYPYFIGHEGRGNVYIGAFVGYLKPESLALETRSARDKRTLNDTEHIVADGIFKILWREHHRFILRRSESIPAPQMQLPSDRSVGDKLPLVDSEWKQYIEVR